MARVNQYERITTNTEKGTCFVEILPFTEVQALEAGSVLEPDGLSVEAAKRLCAKWTDLGKHGSLRYSYQVVF